MIIINQRISQKMENFSNVLGEYENAKKEKLEISQIDNLKLKVILNDGEMYIVDTIPGHVDGWYFLFSTSNEGNNQAGTIKFGDNELFVSFSGMVIGTNPQHYFLKE